MQPRAPPTHVDPALTGAHSHWWPRVAPARDGAQGTARQGGICRTLDPSGPVFPSAGKGYVGGCRGGWETPPALSGGLWGAGGAGRGRGHPPLSSQTPAPRPRPGKTQALVWGRGGGRAADRGAPAVGVVCPGSAPSLLRPWPCPFVQRVDTGGAMGRAWGGGQGLPGLGRWNPPHTPGGCCWSGTHAGSPPLPGAGPCSNSAGPWRPLGPGGEACRRAAPSFPLGLQAPGGLGTKGGLCPLWARSHPALPCRPRGRCLRLQPSKDPLASLQGPASRSAEHQPPAWGLRALPRLSHRPQRLLLQGLPNESLCVETACLRPVAHGCPGQDPCVL